MAAYIKIDASNCSECRADTAAVTNDTSTITSTPLNVKVLVKTRLWLAAGESSAGGESLREICVVRVRQTVMLVKCVASLRVPMELW